MFTSHPLLDIFLLCSGIFIAFYLAVFLEVTFRKQIVKIFTFILKIPGIILLDLFLAITTIVSLIVFIIFLPFLYEAERHYL